MLWNVVFLVERAYGGVVEAVFSTGFVAGPHRLRCVSQPVEEFLQNQETVESRTQLPQKVRTVWLCPAYSYFFRPYHAYSPSRTSPIMIAISSIIESAGKQSTRFSSCDPFILLIMCIYRYPTFRRQSHPMQLLSFQMQAYVFGPVWPVTCEKYDTSHLKCTHRDL